MLFFDKEILTDEMILALKESRKVLVKNKVINYADNFVEVVNFEKGLRVFPKNDELLDMINSIERFDPIVNAIVKGEYKNYSYKSLPGKLKKYMYVMDSLFFNAWVKNIRRVQTVEDYDRREEHLYKMIETPSDDDFEQYVVLGKTIPSTVGRKAKESARRSYKIVQGLMRANVHLFSTFLTLTFALEEHKDKYLMLNRNKMDEDVNVEFEFVNATDFEIAKEKFSSFINTLSKTIKRKGLNFEYVAVWELQKNGNYHFHILCSDIPDELVFKTPSWLDYDFRKQRVNHGQSVKYWKYGKSDVQKIHSIDRITTYVSKYIIKSFYNVSDSSYSQYLHKKKYFPSKGLKKPVETYESDKKVDEIFSEMEIANRVAFMKEYENPYNDSVITKSIYTLL